MESRALATDSTTTKAPPLCHLLPSCRVGNALGAGNAPLAKLAALAACISTPVVWAAAATILLAPPSQQLLISLFTSGDDDVLRRRIHGLLHIVVVLLGFDGAQTGKHICTCVRGSGGPCGLCDVGH
mgnify:CR=1 FL=1